MAEWKHKVSITHVLEPYQDLDDSEITSEDVQKIGNQIADILEANSCFEDFMYTDQFRDLVDVEDFDDVMTDLYNYCDANRIWIGINEDHIDEPPNGVSVPKGWGTIEI